jgi:integrase
MLRCGLRVGEVSRVSWSAIDLTQGTVRIDNGKGHVDRVVYLSPDVAKALRQWHGLQVAEATYKKAVGRPKGLPSTIVNVRIPLPLLAQLDRYLDRLEGRTGLKANRGMITRRALELFLASHASDDAPGGEG